MTVQFAQPSVLLLLPLIPLLTIWASAVHSRRAISLSAFVSPSMQRKLMPASSRGRDRWQIALFAAGLFLGVIAAARPQWGESEEAVRQRARDLVIALDEVGDV